MPSEGRHSFSLPDIEKADLCLFPLLSLADDTAPQKKCPPPKKKNKLTQHHLDGPPDVPSDGPPDGPPDGPLDEYPDKPPECVSRRIVCLPGFSVTQQQEY